jgi:ribosome-associated protein
VTTRKAPTKKTSKHHPSAKTARKPAGKSASKPAGRGKKVAHKAPPKSKPHPRRAPSAELPAVRPIDEKSRRDSLANAKLAISAALDKKAVEPVLIDVCGRSSYADFIAVVSGRSDRQVDAIAEGVCEAMAVQGRRPIGREGARNGRWVLIDFGDVVMHVFYHPLREVFDIESLWIDAPRVKLQVPAEARIEAAGSTEPS